MAGASASGDQPGYPWPATSGRSRPEWTGTGFLVDGRRVGVLAYHSAKSGWSEGLTSFHESVAGDDHPIDLLSRDWASAALRRHLRNPRSTILEVGCSSGFMVRRLHAEWPSAVVMGSDFVSEPLERLAVSDSGIPLLQFDLLQCPLPDASVDATVLLNVLEHIRDDRGAVAQLVRILKPGGVAVIEVPAGPHLYDAYDEYLQHERRYTARTLRALLEGCGLEVVEQSHLGFSVYPAFVRVKRRNQKLGASSVEARRRVVESSIQSTKSGSLLKWALRLEALAGRWVSYPTGIRTVAVARRPEVAS
jgi:ubiquinone/menaquinone biosynthesis C-methylase UbiE